MSFKKGDLVKIKEDAYIYGISEDQTYAVVVDEENGYIRLVDDFNDLKRVWARNFEKVESNIEDPSPKKSPDKILFVQIDTESILNDSILEAIRIGFASKFPEHTVILVTKNIYKISEVVDGKVTIIYERDKTEPAPLVIASPGKEKPWWEYMPITVSTTTIDLGDLSMVHSTNYQTNIFDYLNSKKVE